MSSDNDDSSVFNEPHFGSEPKRIDPSEAKAEQTLRGSGDRAEDRQRTGQSVYDEPDVLPDRPAEILDQTWSCDRCGYNLRGLQTGHPCPECGHRSVYRPAPAGAVSYASWLAGRMQATSPGRGWAVAAVLAVAGGLWAVLAALAGTTALGFVGLFDLWRTVVLGPAVEEVMKIAAVAVIVEVRPYLFRRVEQLWAATIGAAVLFAAIENVLYLVFTLPNPTVSYSVWRWTVCVGIHVGCTMVATRGLIDVWQTSITELRQPRLAGGMRALAVAVIIHGSYNAMVILFDYLSPYLNI